MNKYTKFGFTLGQQLTLDGEDVLIVGFYNYVKEGSYIRYSPIAFDGINLCLRNEIKEIEPKILEDMYEAYVAGLGAGILSIKMPDKYRSGRNPFVFETREWKNWNLGFVNGQQHQYNKDKHQVIQQS